jgi:hypothetical protein
VAPLLLYQGIGFRYSAESLGCAKISVSRIEDLGDGGMPNGVNFIS